MAELRQDMEPYDAFDIVANLYFLNVPVDADTYEASSHQGLISVVECAGVICLERSHRYGSGPREMPVDGHTAEGWSDSFNSRRGRTIKRPAGTSGYGSSSRHDGAPHGFRDQPCGSDGMECRARRCGLDHQVHPRCILVGHHDSHERGLRRQDPRLSRREGCRRRPHVHGCGFVRCHRGPRLRRSSSSRIPSRTMPYWSTSHGSKPRSTNLSSAA